MKLKTTTILLTALLTACTSGTIIKPQIVTVDKPVFSCPVPPVVNDVQLLTSTLTEQDRKDPGKVAQYYKADIIQLQGQIQQYKTVIESYKNISQQLQTMQNQADKIHQSNVDVLQSTKPAQ